MFIFYFYWFNALPLIQYIITSCNFYNFVFIFQAPSRKIWVGYVANIYPASFLGRHRLFQKPTAMAPLYKVAFMIVFVFSVTSFSVYQYRLHSWQVAFVLSVMPAGLN
jgi:hypothetical protein